MKRRLMQTFAVVAFAGGILNVVQGALALFGAFELDPATVAFRASLSVGALMIIGAAALWMESSE